MRAQDVAFICQWYEPEPVAQPGWIVSALRRQGLDVGVLTGIPNYPTGNVEPGYRAWRPRTERIDRVTVRRAPLYPSHDSSTFGRLLNYGSWAIGAAIFGLRTLRRSRASLVYSSPATAAFPAMVARWLFGVPYVLLIQDVWPDSIFASGFLGGSKRRLIEWILTRFVDATYRYAHHIAVISPGMADLLVSRGVSSEKISVVYNWVDEDPTRSTDGSGRDLRADLGIAPTDFVVMYAGNHGTAQALDTAVEAFAGLSAQTPAHLVMVGDGVAKPELISRARRLGADNVHFVAPVPRHRMVQMMGEADAHLVSLARRPLFAVTTPSKLQSIMAAGHPVLVAADGDAARIVVEAQAGVAAPAEDAHALRGAVESLVAQGADGLRAMGRNGREHYEATMAAEVGAIRLADLLREAAAARRGDKK